MECESCPKEGESSNHIALSVSAVPGLVPELPRRFDQGQADGTVSGPTIALM